MSFLKIDKKNIFSFSKIVLVIAFVAIFSFGFAEKTFAEVFRGPANGLPAGVVIDTSQSQGRTLYLSNADNDGYLDTFQDNNLNYWQMDPNTRTFTKLPTPTTDKWGRVLTDKGYIWPQDFNVPDPTNANPTIVPINGTSYA